MAENISTPGSKTDKKREATSPPIPDETVTEKKTRHTTGDGANALALDGETDYGAFGDPMVQDDHDDTVVHMLTQPMDPNDIVRIATELRALMLPSVTEAVKEAVKDATTPLQAQINDLKTDLNDIKAENTTLKTKVDELEKTVAKNVINIDSLEQYSRRNTLRISGIPEDPVESTDVKVLELAADLNVNLFSHDIDRSHCVGKPLPGKTRDVIVKFTRYNARRMLYEVRKDLRYVENRDKIFINEDLTKLRSQLLYDARVLARTDYLKAAYSSDGKLFVCDKEDNRHIINTDDDLKEFGDVTEAKKKLDRMRAIQRLRMRSGGFPRPSQAMANGSV